MTEADHQSENDLQINEKAIEPEVTQSKDTQEKNEILDNNTKSNVNDKPKNKDKERFENDNTEDFFKLALKDLEKRRKDLEIEVEKLTNKKTQIEKELSTSFSGQSDSIARKVKGFQDYLTGALQNLSQSVEQLELISQPLVVNPSPLDQNTSNSLEEEEVRPLPAISDTFKPDKEIIIKLFEQYLEGPDYYADPWKFRRSLELEDCEILKDWFFNMGGRGAQPSRGNRSRNVLLSAALIAVLGELYGDRFQALVLASQPERLGEWRRGLQDALGLNREDFGPNSGVVLFERSGPLIERADRLEEANEVPLILIDAAEKNIEIPILQFPIWLAFAAKDEELYIEEELI